MNAQEIINDVIDRSSEYLEMVDDPSAFIAEVLANKVIQLQLHVEYLQKRLEINEYRNIP